MFSAIICLVPFIVVPLILSYQHKCYKLKEKEKKEYETMLLSPSDTTVSQYIQAFLDSYPNSKVRVTDVNDEKKNLEDKLRQTQGYQIISQSPNVSAQVKEQLRKAFVTKGVPIQ